MSNSLMSCFNLLPVGPTVLHIYYWEITQ